jgi:preprotein translocase subunit SecG
LSASLVNHDFLDMYTFLVVILVLVSGLLITAVLLQAGKGGGLAASFGGASSSADAFLGTRQVGNLLTKSSWWLGGVFLGLAFVLQLMSSRASTPRSILDEPTAPASAPAPTRTQPTGTTTPVVPLEQPPAPAPGQTTPATPPRP